MKLQWSSPSIPMQVIPSMYFSHDTVKSYEVKIIETSTTLSVVSGIETETLINAKNSVHLQAVGTDGANR